MSPTFILPKLQTKIMAFLVRRSKKMCNRTFVCPINELARRLENYPAAVAYAVRSLVVKKYLKTKIIKHPITRVKNTRITVLRDAKGNDLK